MLEWIQGNLLGGRIANLAPRNPPHGALTHPGPTAMNKVVMSMNLSKLRLSLLAR